MPKKIKELDKQEALELTRKDYNNARQSSSLDFSKFAEYYKLFRNEQTEKNYSGLANLFIPEPYRIIRKKTAKLANAIKSIKVTPEGPSDMETSKIGNILLNFLRRKLNWFMTERSAIQESRIIGLSWIKAIWNLDKEEVDKPWKGFDLSMQTADNVLLAPGTTMLDVFEGNIDWLIHSYESSIEDLEKNPNYSKQDIDILKERGGNHKEESALEQSRFIYQNKNYPNTDKKKHLILERWGNYNGKNYLIVVADNAVVLRFEKNPYEEILGKVLPFVPIVANVIGQELYPVGDIEPALSLFNELNDTRNQRMDTVTLNIDPPKEIVKGAQIDEKELIARRGWTIHSNIPGGVRFIPPDMQGVRAAIDEEQVIRGDIQQVTGVLDFAQGSDVQGGMKIDTATGAIVAKGEADVVTDDEINVLKICLRMLYRIVLAYSQAFLDREFPVMITEKGADKFYNITPQSIQGNFDLDIEMKTLQDKTTEQQLKLMMFNQAKTVPGANMGRFFTDVLEAFYDNVNIQEYYQPPQPIPEQPKISIALRGELNPLETSDFAQIAGAKPQSGDPLLNKDLRNLMRGDLPEYNEKENMSIERQIKQKELNNPLQ